MISKYQVIPHGQVCLHSIAICKVELFEETSRFNMDKILKNPGLEPILEKIFEYSDLETLGSCRLVSKYWNQVVQNPSFWFNFLKWGNPPEEILQEWKELALKLKDNVQLSQNLWKCLLWNIKFSADDGFLSPEFAASAMGFVPLLKFMATYTKIDFSRKGNNGGNPENKKTPIHYGVRSGKVEIMKYFYDLGYDLNISNEEDWTLFLSAVWYGHVGVIEFLASVLENPLSRVWHGLTPFHVAAREGCHESLKCLLKIKNDPNVRISNDHADFPGATPLHLATDKGHLECVKILTSHGSKPDCQMANGVTPIHIAALKGHLEIIQHFASIIVNINDPVTKNSQSTPLHMAAMCGHLEVAKHLVSCIKNINVTDKYGYTPFYLAVERGHDKMVEYLAKFTNNPNEPFPFRNLTYTTPLKMASRKNDSKMVKVLLIALSEKMDTNPQDIMNTLKRYE